MEATPNNLRPHSLHQNFKDRSPITLRDLLQRMEPAPPFCKPLAFLDGIGRGMYTSCEARLKLLSTFRDARRRSSGLERAGITYRNHCSFAFAKACTYCRVSDWLAARWFEYSVEGWLNVERHLISAPFVGRARNLHTCCRAHPRSAIWRLDLPVGFPGNTLPELTGRMAGQLK